MSSSTEDTDSALTPRRGQPLRLFLRGSDGQSLRGILGWVASQLGLDVYGENLLTRRASVEMKSAALILLVIFLFDLGAWSLLFNTLLHSELLAIDGWSVLAGSGGLLFASAVILYERQFFTTDVWEGWRSVYRPMAVRLLVIFASALVTAQPVELLFFKEAIAQRAHEEGIRREVVTRRQEVSRINNDLASLRKQIAALPTKVQEEIEYKEYSSAQDRMNDLESKQLDLVNEIARAKGNITYWLAEGTRRRDALSVARSRLASSVRPVGIGLISVTHQAAEARVQQAASAVEAARRAEQHWRNRLSSSERELRSVESQLPGAKSAVSEKRVNFQERRKQLEGNLEAKIQTSNEAEKRIERWVRQLREEQPGRSGQVVERNDLPDQLSEAASGEGASNEFYGSDLDKNPTHGVLLSANVSAKETPEAKQPSEAQSKRWVYRFPKYHFFRQLRVLKDLREGSPPLWEGVSTGEAERLGQEYGLEATRNCDEESVLREPAGKAAAPCDGDRWRRHQQQAAIFRWSWLVVYGVAFIIPMLVIAMKLLMPPELKAYYSGTCQALAGNPEAIAARQVIGSFRRDAG